MATTVSVTPSATVTGYETPAARPLILIDVDGVLNVLTTVADRQRLTSRDGWTEKWVDNFAGRFRLLCNPAHGPLLLRLAADTGAELAWGTTWEDDANQFVAPMIGFPPLPVAPVAGFPGKADGIVPWTNGRPFVWFDDQASVAERAAHLAAGRPHLMIRPNPATGLAAAHVNEARQWLLALSANVAATAAGKDNRNG